MSDYISKSEALKLIPCEEIAARMVVSQMPTIELRRERDWNGWEDGKGGTYLYDERVLDIQPSIGNIDSTSIVNCGSRMERREE